MNSLGRHYRDPTDPENPSCNYESGGVQCTFYSESEYASLPYPSDITLGPVSDPEVDLSTILAAIHQQKEETERYRQEQAHRMQLLQNQVNGILGTTPHLSLTL